MKNTNNNIINEISTINIEKGHIINLYCDTVIDLNESNLRRQIECVYNNELDFKNRFINRRELKTTIDKNFCAYILSNYKRIINDDASTELSKLSTIYEPMSFIIHTKILPEFANYYNIPINDYIINATNIKIRNNIDTDDNNILKTKNKFVGVMAMVIMLSYDCLGFSIKFIDDTYITLSTGDAIIYNPRLLSESQHLNGNFYFLSFEIEIVSLLHIKNDIY
jgi:hypothetical protein